MYVYVYICRMYIICVCMYYVCVCIMLCILLVQKNSAVKLYLELYRSKTRLFLCGTAHIPFFIFFKCLVIAPRTHCIIMVRRERLAFRVRTLCACLNPFVSILLFLNRDPLATQNIRSTYRCMACSIWAQIVIRA